MSAPPNIVFILADDMGYGDIGAFGNNAVRTPALDQLASEGLRLTQHYSGSPVCAPARAAFMTGRYPHRTGAVDTMECRGTDRLGLREVTIADRLKSAGYATGCVGKWHLGALDPRYHPNARGFDEFAGFRGGWSDYWKWRLDCNGSMRPADGRYLTDVLAEEAVDFIERHHWKPFFLHVAFNAPHFPMQAPEEDLKLFREMSRFGEGVCAVYAMNRVMDRGVALIREALRAHGLEENTLLIFTSDNGPQMNVAKDGTGLLRYNGGFNGGKGFVYEGGVRAPAILRWPAGLPGGGVALHDFSHFTDWLPTLLKAAGVEPPRDRALDGEDILPMLRGERGCVNEKRFWQWNRNTPAAASNAAMRDGPWKLLRPRMNEAMKLTPEEHAMDRRMKYEPESVTDILHGPIPDPEIPPPPPALLFNLDEDPYEQQDLAAREPAQLVRMQRELDRWFEGAMMDYRAARD